jgi:hypothetical protein
MIIVILPQYCRLRAPVVVLLLYITTLLRLPVGPAAHRTLLTPYQLPKQLTATRVDSPDDLDR